MYKLALLLVIALTCITCRKKDNPIEENPFLEDSGEFSDIRDNHVYKWVRIGNQIWMAENLAYLPKVNLHTMEDPDAVCPNLEKTEPHFHVYDYTGANVDEAKSTVNYATYGVLYNWFGAKEACPAGWHIPTDDEWEQLAKFISEENGPYQKVDQTMTKEGKYWLDVGKHLKATSGWESQGSGTDDYGFAALPSGFSAAIDRYDAVGFFTRWWSATEFSSTDVWVRGVSYGTRTLTNYNDHKIYLYSVRCIKD